jgi:hypothetical protein
MSPAIEPNINPVIWAAIEQRRLLRFRYKNRERIIEPHDYGIHNGVIKLPGFQIGGSSSHKLPNWRWAEQKSAACPSRPSSLRSVTARNRLRPDRDTRRATFDTYGQLFRNSREAAGSRLEEDLRGPKNPFGRDLVEKQAKTALKRPYAGSGRRLQRSDLERERRIEVLVAGEGFEPSTFAL